MVPQEWTLVIPGSSPLPPIDSKALQILTKKDLEEFFHATLFNLIAVSTFVLETGKVNTPYRWVWLKIQSRVPSKRDTWTRCKNNIKLIGKNHYNSWWYQRRWKCPSTEQANWEIYAWVLKCGWAFWELSGQTPYLLLRKKYRLLLYDLDRNYVRIKNKRNKI